MEGFGINSLAPTESSAEEAWSILPKLSSFLPQVLTAYTPAYQHLRFMLHNYIWNAGGFPKMWKQSSSLFKNKTKQRKTKHLPPPASPSSLLSRPLPPLSPKENTWGLIRLNPNFICMQIKGNNESAWFTMVSEKSSHVFWVSSTVNLFYSFKFIFDISSLSLWQGLRPYQFLLRYISFHYNSLMNILALSP